MASSSRRPISPMSSASGNDHLYGAYNDLHALAQARAYVSHSQLTVALKASVAPTQDFKKPFDAPAILVLGHQTDGKSGV